MLSKCENIGKVKISTTAFSPLRSTPRSRQNNHHLRRLEMVSWCPCMVAQARALSRYIPRASGAALCFSKSSTTLVYPVNRVSKMGRQIYTAMCLSKSASSLIIISILALLCSTIKRVGPPWCVRPLRPRPEQSCHGCRWLPPWHQPYHTCCLIIVPCSLGEKTLDYVKVALG